MKRILNFIKSLKMSPERRAENEAAAREMSVW